MIGERGAWSVVMKMLNELDIKSQITTTTMDLTAPSTEDCSLVEVTSPAKKVKTSEDDIEAVLDGKHGNDSSLQKRGSTCTSEAVVDSQPTKKAKTSAEDEKMCSVCKVTKNRLDCFSKKERKNKRGNAKCKDCNIKANSKMTPAEKVVAAASRKLKEEAKRNLEAQKHMQKVKKYAEMDEQKYNKTKKVYEDGLKELKENNIDFEKEMKRRTEYLFVVTSVSADGDPFSPVLHGIYTTCKKAQDAARRAFEKVSRTYRNGAFVPSHDRLSKCDLSEFLVPAKRTETCRPLYEAFTEEDDHYCHYTAVAISTIRMVDGKASGFSLPLISGYFQDQLFNPKHVKNIEEARPKQNEEPRKSESEITEVYAIFDQYPGNMVSYSKLQLY